MFTIDDGYWEIDAQNGNTEAAWLRYSMENTFLTGAEVVSRWGCDPKVLEDAIWGLVLQEAGFTADGKLLFALEDVEAVEAAHDPAADPGAFQLLARRRWAAKVQRDALYHA